MKQPHKRIQGFLRAAQGASIFDHLEVLVGCIVATNPPLPQVSIGWIDEVPDGHEVVDSLTHHHPTSTRNSVFQ